MLTSNSGEKPEEPFAVKRAKAFLDSQDFGQLKSYFEGRKATGDKVRDAYLPDGRFVPKLVGDVMMGERTFVTFRNKEMYVYDGGYYKADAETFIAEWCKEILGEEFRSRRYSEVVSYIQASSFVDRESLTPPPNLIAVANGILDFSRIEQDILEIKPFSPDYFFLNKLPVNYSVESKCPNFDKFLSEVVSAKDALVLQEFAGFVLLPDYRFQKMLLLVGEGGNGKTRFLDVLTALCGEGNVANLSLQTLCEDQFAKASLYNKMLNCYADLPKRALKNTGDLKVLSGDDRIAARTLYRGYFNFPARCKLLFSANQVPFAYDDTDAFYDRFLVVTFPNRFRNTDREDPDLKRKLTTQEELSGILNWALAGLKRLLTQKGFSQKLGPDQARDRYKRLSSPVYAFVSDILVFDGNSQQTKDELCNAFTIYCNKHRLIPPSRDTALKLIRYYMPGLREERQRTPSGRTHVFKGVRIIEDEETGQISSQPTLHDYNRTGQTGQTGQGRVDVLDHQLEKGIVHLPRADQPDHPDQGVLATALTSVRVRCTVPTCAKEFDLETAPDILLGNSRCPYCGLCFLERVNGGEQSK